MKIKEKEEDIRSHSAIIAVSFFSKKFELIVYGNVPRFQQVQRSVDEDMQAGLECWRECQRRHAHTRQSIKPQ